MQSLSSIYVNTFTALNIVATPEQQLSIFTVACREFFSYVIPLHNIQTIQDIWVGKIILDDSQGLQIGKYRIVTITEISTGFMMGVKPIDYNDFMLDYGYIGAFQYVCEYMLKKTEKDNYLMIKSSGIEEPESIDIESIAELRDYLKKEFSVTPASLI